MATRLQVLSDIALLRQSLRRAGNPHLPLLKLQGWRPALDVTVDITAIVAALLLALQEPWAAPLALLILGNRQRALGNILHDAAHRNLTRNRLLNDLVTRALIAPLLFVSLSHYRELHFRHHLDLGAQGADPDLIPIPAQKARSWVAAVAANTLSLRAIGAQLEAMRETTPRGGRSWAAASVKNLLDRARAQGLLPAGSTSPAALPDAPSDRLPETVRPPRRTKG